MFVLETDLLYNLKNRLENLKDYKKEVNEQSFGESKRSEGAKEIIGGEDKTVNFLRETQEKPN